MQRKAVDFILKYGNVLAIGLLMLAPTAFGMEDSGSKGYCAALGGLHTYLPPILKIASLFFVIGGVAMSFVEFVRRQIGWAFGAFVVGIVIGAVLFALAGVADKQIGDLYNAQCGH
jgi:ABC-type transport system involved in cytochrome c biogenesis permease subunit